MTKISLRSNKNAAIFAFKVNACCVAEVNSAAQKYYINNLWECFRQTNSILRSDVYREVARVI